MRRTNIFLTDEQCSALDALARDQGVSRAEVVRRILDLALLGDDEDLTADLAAIEDSFGVLSGEEIAFERGIDGRSQHLQHIASR